MEPDVIDLKNPDLYVAGVPHEVFTRLRREDPLHWNAESDGSGFWCVTRYEDIVTISKDPARFSSAREHGGHRMFDERTFGLGASGTGGATLTEAPMISIDPPAHVTYRRLVTPGFTPARMRALEDQVRSRACAILDQLIDQAECEFVSEVAAELPIQVLAELLGVPQEDRHKLFAWSNTMIGEDDPEMRSGPADIATALREMSEYSLRLWQERVARPGSDLISMLAASRIDGEAVSIERYLGTFILLVVAGNETTRNSISGGLIALTNFPAERQRLIERPELLASAASEIVRYVTPVMHMRRTAVYDFEMRGKLIRAGDKVIMWYCSANRDEEIFRDPFRFELGRAGLPQLGFGIGEHYCLGARLAELQLRIFFDEFLKRFPTAAPCGPIRRMRSNFINGIKEMAVRLKHA
ncbi:MAG TPA: cytochrome P450 [Candidatus Binataceae bacterium]|nr:cytochrome P450 [Candidatus Binataceae bacterium]